MTTPAAARDAAPHRGLDQPLAPTDQAADHRAQQSLTRDRLWRLLSEVFPEAFRLPPVPLAIGIHKQILDIAGDSIDATELGAFMRYWVRRWSYLMAVWRGEPRRNLDGSVADNPTVEHRNAAGRWLWGSRYRPIPESTDKPAITAEMPPQAAKAS